MPARKLTDDQEEELVRRYMEGVATQQLASDYAVTDVTVRNVLCRRGVTPFRGQAPLTDVQKERALRLVVQAGRSLDAVSRDLGVSKGALSKALRRDCALPKRPSTKRKKLTKEQRAEIASLYKEYTTYEELCARFKCSPSVIREALSEHGIVPRVGWTKYRTVCWTDRRGREHIFKSSWELAFAQYLDAQNLDWVYEPTSYTLPIRQRYTPDFEVYDSNGNVLRLIEIHGRLDRKTEDRWVEFLETYPDLPFELLGPRELASLGLIEESWAQHPQADKVTKASVRLNRVLH